jgi:Uma2 family endonuclease
MTPASTPEAVQMLVKDDAWLPATWDEYCQCLTAPEYERAKGYYYKGYMRLEMAPLGFDHAEGDITVSYVINLLGTLYGAPLRVLANCTFRKPGRAECQPDLACYVGDRVRVIPFGTGVIDLTVYPMPNVVIEISKSSLLDDLGVKRSLYEALGVEEYWVVDVNRIEVTAYEILDQGSQGMECSQVLPGLSVSVLTEALRRSRETDQSQVGAWLLSQFQP